jgi:hypothetical protein
MLYQTPFRFKAPLWPRSIRPVIFVVLCNSLPENASSLLVSHNSVLGHKENRVAQLLLLCPVKNFALDSGLCWPSFVARPRCSLLPPSRHCRLLVQDSRARHVRSTASPKVVCRENQAPSTCRAGACKYRGRLLIPGCRWASGAVAGRKGR